VRAVVVLAALLLTLGCVRVSPPPVRGTATVWVDPSFTANEQWAIDLGMRAWTRGAPECARFVRVPSRPARVVVLRAPTRMLMTAFAGDAHATGVHLPGFDVDTVWLYPVGLGKTEPEHLAWVAAMTAHELGHAIGVGGRTIDGRWTLHTWGGLMAPLIGPDALDYGELRPADVAMARRECAR
jgi:hypothetical protein